MVNKSNLINYISNIISKNTDLRLKTRQIKANLKYKKDLANLEELDKLYAKTEKRLGILRDRIRQT